MEKTRIHIIECGNIKHPKKDPSRIPLVGNFLFKTIKRNSPELPVNAFLIEHPLGNLLVDTGVDDCIVGKLGELGFAPSDIDVITCSCFDADHTGGLKPIVEMCGKTANLNTRSAGSDTNRKKPRVLLPDEEFYWMQRNVFKHQQPIENVEGFEHERFFFKASQDGPHHYSYDVFGDESVMLYLCTGHTFGTFSTKITNKNTGKFVMLASDIILDSKTYEESTVFHRGNQDESVRWLREQSTDPNCVAILPTHEACTGNTTIEL